MSDYKLSQAEKHVVVHEHSGRAHHFVVISGNSGDNHHVSLQVACDCRSGPFDDEGHQPLLGFHALAVLQKVALQGQITLTDKDVLQERRNACAALVRLGNRALNEVRVSPGESRAHQDKKIAICKDLLLHKKHFMTEAIFESGGRADVLVLDDFKAIEIVQSEDQASLARKAAEYPDGLRFEVVRA